MRQSENIGKIAAALTEAQKKFTTAAKDGDNPHFRSHYATIESVLDAVVPALNAQGIAVIQRPAADDYQGACLETMLVHNSGEWISSLIKIPSGKNDAHGYGSAYTYARRYSLAAMCGLKQGDDDGNAAVEQDKAEQKKASADDKIKAMPRDIMDGFAWLKKQPDNAKMHSGTFRAGVVAVIDANNGDPEAIRSYLRDKGYKAGEPDVSGDGMP